MASLVNHLERINQSAGSIGELEFAPSRPFTNALLHNNEITALIRDPEVQERGLFSVRDVLREGENQSKNKSLTPTYGASRLLIHADKQRQESAVARVLGNDMLTRIQQSNRHRQRGRGVDIEILLQGAEKLCQAYDVPGTMERINALRGKYKRISASIAGLETRVSEQQNTLSSYNAGLSHDDQDWEVGTSRNRSNNTGSDTRKDPIEFDLEGEEQVILELEMRKRALEARVSAIEKDLGEFLQ